MSVEKKIYKEHKSFIQEQFIKDVERILWHRKQREDFKLTSGGWIYIMQLGDTDIYKIGISIHPEIRLKQLQRKCPIPIKLIYQAYGDDYRFAEKYIHKFFKKQNVSGEWFKLEPRDLIWVVSQVCKIQLPAQDYNFELFYRN